LADDCFIETARLNRFFKRKKAAEWANISSTSDSKPWFTRCRHPNWDSAVRSWHPTLSPLLLLLLLLLEQEEPGRSAARTSHMSITGMPSPARIGDPPSDMF
jgi:hypothetical protein